MAFGRTAKNIENNIRITPHTFGREYAEQYSIERMDIRAFFNCNRNISNISVHYAISICSDCSREI